LSLEHLTGELEVRQIPHPDEVLAKRLENIRWGRALDREGLSFGAEEKQLLILTTGRGERVYIQYPGKETVPNSKGKVNKWDFRPKVQLANGDGYAADQTFRHIWDSLLETMRVLRETSPEAESALAMLFFRMAHMLDYSKATRDVPIPTRRLGSGLFPHSGQPATESFKPFWAYHPPAATLSELSKRIPDIGSMSFEAFLHYNSLLAWNEDCKYIDPDGTRESLLQWKGGSHTLLTHLRVMGIIAGHVKLTSLLYDLSHRGVSNPTIRECVDICRPWLKYERRRAGAKTLDGSGIGS